MRSVRTYKHAQYVRAAPYIAAVPYIAILIVLTGMPTSRNSHQFSVRVHPTDRKGWDEQRQDVTLFRDESITLIDICIRQVFTTKASIYCAVIGLPSRYQQWFASP